MGDQIKNMQTTGNSLDLNEPKQNKEEAVKQTIPDSNHQIKLTETVEKQTLNTDLVIDAKINEQPKEHDAHMVVDENLSKNIENYVNGSSGSMQLLNGHSHLPNSEPLTLGSLVSLSMKADDDF